MCIRDSHQGQNTAPDVPGKQRICTLQIGFRSQFSVVGIDQTDMGVFPGKILIQILLGHKSHSPLVQHGRFGASMQVESINDGPVTLILDTQQLMEESRRK